VCSYWRPNLIREGASGPLEEKVLNSMMMEEEKNVQVERLLLSEWPSNSDRFSTLTFSWPAFGRATASPSTPRLVRLAVRVRVACATCGLSHPSDCWTEQSPPAQSQGEVRVHPLKWRRWAGVSPREGQFCEENAITFWKRKKIIILNLFGEFYILSLTIKSTAWQAGLNDSSM